MLFESLYGAGDRDSDEATSDDYKGRLLIAYEAAVGTGDRDSNDTTSDDYKGTALIALERIVGNGDRDVTPEQDAITAITDGTDDVPDDYRGSAQIAYDTALAGTTITGTGVDTALEPFDISDPSSLLTCEGDACTQVGNVFWVTFTEDGDNDSIFTNAPDDDSNIKTTSDARRGLSFSIEYDDSVTSAIEYATTDIVIDAGDEWNSGEEIAITLTDSDANTNSLAEETLEVADTDRVIPTIRVGDPFTLAGTVSVELETADGDDTDELRDTRTYRDPTVTDVSDILVLDAGTYTGDSTLTINLGEWADVNDYLPQNEKSFKGTHMINYDISALPDAASITLYVGDDDYDLVNVGDDGDAGTKVLTTPAFSPGDPDTDPENFGALYDEDTGDMIDSSEQASLVIELVPADADDSGLITLTDEGSISDAAIIIDIFSFGLDGGSETETDDGEIETEIGNDNVNNAIYRLQLEEDGDSSSDFVGTLEYVGLNQINILKLGTYTGIETISDAIILISDDDSISVEYNDLDSTGGTTLFTAEADTPTHSGSVSLNSNGFKIADTVTVTVEDADLNVDSGKADIYTTYGDVISDADAVMDLLTVLIDGEAWNAGCGLGGLDASLFTLRETGSDSGVFTGTFAVPANHCPSGEANGEAVTVTGTDLSAEYVDFRDDSGSIITVSASAGIRSNTGSVSLDRTVYPVPIGADDTTDTHFPTHGDDLAQHDLTIYVSINDADSDTSSNGIDSIDASTLEISVIRGSDTMVLEIDEDTIDETAPDSGIFEHTQTISYAGGPDSNDCPSGLEGCIVQGDILHVQYTDPSDASGSENTVTDSATFDLRNGVLQVDKPGTTGYVIGTDMIVTLIEPDLNLDSDATETYTLDLIEWDSDADTQPLSDSVFGATPSNLLETGTDTGIFQVVITVPDEIDDEAIQRGEQITLTYNDWGPSGSDYVGDKDEEITVVAYTSDFGASIELDQKVYTWTDKVYITIVAPDHNFDADQVDEIGDGENYPINIKTQEDELEGYKLVETGADTGIFSGELILTGVDNDDLDRQTEDSSGTGPTDGRLAAEDSDGLAIVFENSDGDIVRASAIIQWNVGEVEWLEASYPALGSGIVRVIDPDMNLNPEAVDNFDVNVWSDSDVGGISLTVTETNAATGIFEGTVFFDDSSISSGHRLNVEEGDTVVAEYDDVTSPIEDETSVSATTLIGTIVPPLERAPINNLRAVDTFDNSIGAASVGQQVVITADLSNGQDRDQDFIFLIQVQDENGITVSLNWVLGTLAADQSFSPGASWTPTEAGTYDVTAFVWESIDNPTALSPTATIAITVN